ncbi:MAG: hypothetical protein LUQ37_00125 [Methanoregulaceae archaeon]|jgi:hypothetical protein|nr:hypothetical protein [Methanoregulaceae archaeon]
MEKRYGMYLAYFFMALIALNAVRSLFRGEYNAMVTAFLMLGMTVILFVVAKRMNIHLPWFVFFLVALALWIHTDGYVQGYYMMYYPYYDKIAHIVSGTAVAVLGFLGVFFVDKYMNMNLTAWFIVFFTIIFSVALGAFLEMYEFLVVFFFGGNLAGPMQNSLNDTMLDMMFVFAGSIIVAIIGVFWF